MTSKTIWLLYVTYTFTCLEDRAWNFFTAVILQSIGGMRFVSVGQFSESGVQAVFSGMLGGIIDGLSRKNAIIFVVLVNNLSIFVSVVLLLASMSLTSPWITLYFAIPLCAVNRLFLNAEKAIMGKDWILLMSDEETLSQQNAILTVLDQLWNILAPIGVGALITTIGTHATLTLFGVGALLSLTVKFALIFFIFKRNKTLHYSDRISSSLSVIDKQNKKSQGVLATYYHQSTFCAAFGMTLFYKTAMGFDNLAVGYATDSSSLSVFTISLIRAYGAAAGMAGAISYSFLEKKFGLVKTGLVGIAVQQLSSLIAFLSIAMPGSPLISDTYSISTNYSIPLFLISIATARFGLWCLDLAITHTMQLHVPESERNTVFGVHMALCQAFSVPKELLVVVFTESSQFWMYILSSYICVTLGELFYAKYLRKTALENEENEVFH